MLVRLTGSWLRGRLLHPVCLMAKPVLDSANSRTPNVHPGTSQDLEGLVAQAIWNAMVNDEVPPLVDLWREGFIDAAKAAIETVREHG